MARYFIDIDCHFSSFIFIKTAIQLFDFNWNNLYSFVPIGLLFELFICEKDKAIELETIWIKKKQF